MNVGKYIIIKAQGHEQAILFDGLMAHSDFLVCFHRDTIISAGFFTVGAKPKKNDAQDILIWTWGKSVTLKVGSRKEKDAPLIKRVLRKEY